MRKIVFILFLMCFCIDILYGQESKNGFNDLSIRSQTEIRQRSLSEDTLSIYVYSWNPSRNDWQEEYAQLTIYEHGRIVEYLYLIWEDQKWSNQSRALLAYDEKDNLITEIQQDWDNSNNIWNNLNGFFWERNYITNTIIVYSKYWDISANAWVISAGSRDEYSIYGNDTIIVHKLLDLPTNEWINIWLNTRKRNDDDRLILEVEYSWNRTGWSYVDSVNYYYYENGLLKEMSKNGRYRYLYYYNTKRNLTENIVQIWNEEQWINNNRYLYIYDMNGNKIKYDEQDWDEHMSEWIIKNGHSIVYDYTADNLLIEKYWNNFIFEPSITDSLRLEIKYDGNAVKTEEIIQYWNTNTSLWINREKKVFESTKVIDAISEENGFRFIIPNPYKQSDLIRLDGLNSIKSYRIELHDLTGKEVYSRNIYGNKNFSIDNNLLNGLYLLIIRDKNNLLHVQKLIIEN